jgi:hypothetical protein
MAKRNHKSADLYLFFIFLMYINLFFAYFLSCSKYTYHIYLKAIQVALVIQRGFFKKIEVENIYQALFLTTINYIIDLCFEIVKKVCHTKTDKLCICSR